MTPYETPLERVQRLNDKPVRSDGRYVLYWMNAHRRTRWNWALQRSVELANELGRPLVVLEAVRCGYRWASDRHHAFILQGMADNGSRLRQAGVTGLAYAEPGPGEGRGLLQALASDAAAVVTDDWPCFFLPRAVEAAAGRVGVALERVDANGIIPIRLPDRAFTTAYAFRRWIQREGRPWIIMRPDAEPLERLENRRRVRLDGGVISRWPRATDRLLAGRMDALADLPIDHDVRPVADRGGPAAAEARLAGFVGAGLERYAEERNHPDAAASSGLSPYLHFGHLSSHEVVGTVLDATGWSPDRLAADAAGRREGWWGTDGPTEAFLDQVVTWRELGLNKCVNTSTYDRWESLPDWARATLEEHASDPREHLYTLEELEAARTHDEIWNAAQRELVATGRMHNYLRMLWGKCILLWTESPRQALEVMIELNDKYALDGRDPNSTSGIFWVLGRYDRPWGPERPVFGKVRAMTSRSTRRKLRLAAYLDRWAPADAPRGRPCS